eukprot:GHVT01025815.1.p2 GENE.GHVT01025815.1~~GHVT01025815.1.p2  ORF type:complete len:195 (+),score=54.12 GHVT01025815.1:136-720(+)
MEPAKAWSPRTVRRVFLLGVAVGLLAMLVVTIALWALLRLRRAFCPRFGAPCVAALSRTMAKFLLKLKSCAKGAETSRPLQNARDEESPDGGRANDNGLAFTPGGRRSQAAEVPLKTGQYSTMGDSHSFASHSSSRFPPPSLVSICLPERSAEAGGAAVPSASLPCVLGAASGRRLGQAFTPTASPPHLADYTD